MIHTFDTYLGKHINIDDKYFTTYLFLVKEDTSYGYTYPNVQWHFITGLNAFDADIPKLYIPKLFVDRSGQKHIFIDIRHAVKKNVDNTSKDLRVITSAKSDIDFHIAIAYSMVANDELDVAIKESTLKSLTMWVVHTLRTLMYLDDYDSNTFGILYLAMLINRYQEVDNNNDLMELVERYYFFKGMDAMLINNVIGDAKLENLTDVVKRLKETDVSAKLKGNDVDTIVMVLQSSVFPQHRIPLGVALETPAIWAGIVTAYFTNRIYMKTSLVTRLKPFKRMVKLDTLISAVETGVKNLKPNT